MKKFTLAEFDAIEDGGIIDTGISQNSPDGIFMTNDGGELSWVAVKGYGHDWCIYCHYSYHTTEWVMSHGDKISTTRNIKKCFDVDDEVMSLYRF